MAGINDLSFDDLIPQQDKKPKGIAALSFDDLIPTAADTSPGQAALISGGGMLDRLAAGLKQKTRAVLGDNVVGGIDKLGSVLGMAPSTDLESSQAANKPYMAQLQQDHPVASFAGELPLALAAKTPLGMAGMAALEYGTPQESAMNAGGAFLGGKAGQYLGAGISRAITPIRAAGADAVNATKALFDKYDLTGLPGQITGSVPLQWMESTLAKLPGGGRVRDVTGSQQQGLNRIAMDTMGGAGDVVSPETVRAATNAVGPRFQSIPEGTTVQLDDVFQNRLADIEKNYNKNLSPDQKSVVGAYMDSILSHGDSMPGDVYQKARSRIAARANSTQDSELKGALTGIYKSLDDAFARSASDETNAAYAAARSQYQAIKEIGPLANESGNISPARVANAAKGMPGQLGDLAKLGYRMKQLPDSGTAQRLFYQSLLSGGTGLGVGVATGDPVEAAKWGLGTASAQLAGPWLASQALTRAPLRNYLTNTAITPTMDDLLKRLGSVPGGLLGLRLSQ